VTRRAVRPADDQLPSRTSEINEPVFWDIDDIQFHCRIGRTTAWRLVRDAQFPAPIVVGPKSFVWPRNEVMVFMEARRRPGHYAASVVGTRAPSTQTETVYRRRRVATRARRG
jgi:predicted DNA-binding transcriptional regulator AlpA